MISDELEKTLQRAKVCAESFHHEFMTIEHLLFSMIDDFDVKEIFKACNVDIESLKTELDIFLKENKIYHNPVKFICFSLIDPLKMGIMCFPGANMKFIHYIFGKVNFYILILFLT